LIEKFFLFFFQFHLFGAVFPPEWNDEAITKEFWVGNGFSLLVDDCQGGTEKRVGGGMRGGTKGFGKVDYSVSIAFAYREMDIYYSISMI
jgi:hypothetical protein